MGVFSGLPPGYDLSVMEHPEGSGVFYWSLIDPDGNEAPSYARFASSGDASQSGILKARRLYKRRLLRIGLGSVRLRLIALSLSASLSQFDIELLSLTVEALG